MQPKKTFQKRSQVRSQKTQKIFQKTAQETGFQKQKLKQEFNTTKGWFHKDALLALREPDFTKHIRNNVYLTRSTIGYDMIYVLYKETRDCLKILKVKWVNLLDLK